MNDKDYILVGIELADGWGAYNDGYYFGPYIVGTSSERIKQSAKDALAAQLRRQVRAAGYWISILGNGEVTIIELTTSREPLELEHTLVEAFADDEAMNTIKAVVDSKALEK